MKGHQLASLVGAVVAMSPALEPGRRRGASEPKRASVQKRSKRKQVQASRRRNRKKKR